METNNLQQNSNKNLQESSAATLLQKGQDGDIKITQHIEKKVSRSYSALYLGSSLVGMARVLIGFPIEHPIDSIKTQWQAKPYMKNEMAIIKDIYQTKGIKGFYAGSLPNLTRVLIKNSYRYPLMVGLPRFYNENLPPAISQNKPLQKLLTGSSIALVESVITCPIERTKVYFMTTQQKGLSYKHFYQNVVKGDKIHELFRGFTPLFMRQSTAWIVFLQADLAVKSWIRKSMNIPEKERIPTKYLMPASILVALANTTAVMPFDCVKTHMEKVDPTSTYLRTFQKIYSQAGILGFFTGIRLRFLLYLTNAIFIVNILEKLDSITHKINKE
eukprot:403341656